MTDYDTIAHAYRESKRLPIKQYSEEVTWFQVLESVRDLAVLDVACGDGYYTRAMKRQGASRVVGVDRSAMMITSATREEAAHPLGIAYVIGEAETMPIRGVFDLVTAASLDVTMLTAGGPLHLRNYYWSQGTYESVLHQAGFKRIVWHAMQVSSEGFDIFGSAFWQDYLKHPHIVVLEAQT